MSNRIKKGHCHPDRHMSFSFRVISLMHHNPLLPYFRNPQRLLKAAGLKQGQKALEVGCGPGFFTIPAAKIVGEEGFVYAVDVHPLAIERVKEQIEIEGIKNINCCIYLSCGQKRFPLFELVFALEFKPQDLILEPWYFQV